MTRPVDPYVVRKLADCIELLPRYINNPQKMPFVQDTLRSAFETFRRDREALALGNEIQGDLSKAEQYRQPVQSIPLFDDDIRALEDGFEQDEAGVFKLIEYAAAEVGEWLKDCRHPRDAERFRELLGFVCGEALVKPVKGVEVRPGVYKLDLDSWRDEAAKPLCDYLRKLADEMATEPSPPPPEPSRPRIEVNVKENQVRLDDTWHGVSPGAAVLFDACVNSHPKPVFASHLDGDIRPKRVRESLPHQLKAIFHSVKGQGCWLEI